ncbi:penicillin-binding protein 2 [Aerococcaceae bacterium DSM 111020]|nr:penicillin-binding protein 2 [Aerococcaceae bacterium DSM 111020]
MARFKLNNNAKSSHIPVRMNILFFITFLTFVLLFVRMGYLQLYNGEYFQNMVRRTESTLSTGAVPRGMMYDAQGEVLVGNKPEQAIFFTRGSTSQMSSQDIIKVATELASLIDMPTSDVTERDRKDYFVAKNEREINERLSDEEKQLNGSELNEAQLAKVTDEDIQFSDAELKIVSLYKRMGGTYQYSTVPVKNQNVTEAEIARVSEHLGSLPGISTGTDWQRVYPHGDMMRSILGQVSTEQRGLPEESAQDLLTRGYAMNDRVGISYLEQQYEDALKGTKSQYNIISDATQNAVETNQLYEGNRGDNIMLTVNAAFQQEIERIAEEALQNMGEFQGMNDRVYIVAMDPSNGDVLGITGKRFAYDEATDSYDRSEIVDDAQGAVNSSFGMGSSIKPAMVATGYVEDIISTDNNTITDEPMKFAASQEKSSVFNRTGQVPITDIEALQKSSNVYMIKLAMMIGGQTSHEENGPLTIDPNTMNVIRGHLAEFGLGTQTGIDLPIESAGFSPESDQLVNAIDLSYGQFDLYTPLQMAQFVSTIANGGIRYAPRLVKEIRQPASDGKPGGVVASIDSRVMNVVPIEPAEMDRIHEGMHQVSHTGEGTARYLFQNYPINVGSKTGTAEAFYAGPIQYAQNQPVTNATYVGFAPLDNPRIAITVIVPYLQEESTGRESTQIAHEVMNAYFLTQSDYRETIENYAGTSQSNNNASNQNQNQTQNQTQTTQPNNTNDQATQGQGQTTQNNTDGE